MTAALESNEHRISVRVMRISDATDLWLGAVDLSDRTEDTYRRLLNKFAGEHHGHVDIDEITLTHIRGFLDRQARLAGGGRKSNGTIAQNVSIMQGFFDWLSKEGIVARNPTRRNGDRVLTRPRQVRPDENDNVTTVSTDDVRKLLATSATMPWPERLAVAVAVYSGARRRALANLRVFDYDPVGRRLTFSEKGGKRISKPVPHELAQVIDAAIIAGVYETDDDYLIPSRATQRRKGDRDDRIIWNLIRSVAEKAGVRTHVHALRAAFAVHYLESNPGGLIALQKLMGHARNETTLVYLRRLDRQQQMETVRDLSWGEVNERAASTGDMTPEAEAVPPEADGKYARDARSLTSPQIAEEPLESNPLAEKEGFEPSFDAKPGAKRVGTQSAAAAPGEGDDEPPDLALLAKVRAIKARGAEVVE